MRRHPAKIAFHSPGELTGAGTVTNDRQQELRMKRYSKTCGTFVDDWTLLTIDADEVRAVSLEDMHERGVLLYRPLTKAEKMEVICMSLRYGYKGILYWAFKALTLWFTKEVYPQQGKPSSPRSKETRTSPPERCMWHWCRPSQSGQGITLASRSKALRRSFNSLKSHIIINLLKFPLQR